MIHGIFFFVGIRMLDQPYMTDLIEANSMGHEPNLIDIYSASWGPTDDGKTVDGPRNATMRAIVKGVNEVRCSNVFCKTLRKTRVLGRNSFEYSSGNTIYGPRRAVRGPSTRNISNFCNHE